MQAARGGDSPFVPVVVVLTDGQATQGVTNPQEIAQNVKAVNSDGVNAIIYGLAFGDNADYNLLSGISIQNGGHAARIYVGYGSSVTQMENFYVENLGTILMSDVNVVFDGTVVIDSKTQTQFPVFAGGSEVVVRARVLDSATDEPGGDAVSLLGATTTANTPEGINTWRTEASGWGDIGLPPSERNECVQSFAHSKISELMLMLFRDAAQTLGSEMHYYYNLYSLQNGLSADASRGGVRKQRVRRQEVPDVVSLVEDEALQLALEAGVVWPGLTAMVTVESDACVDAAAGVEVCYDGDGEGAGAGAGDQSDEAQAADVAYSAAGDDNVMAQSFGSTSSGGSGGGAPLMAMVPAPAPGGGADADGGYYDSAGSRSRSFGPFGSAVITICIVAFDLGYF